MNDLAFVEVAPHVTEVAPHVSEGTSGAHESYSAPHDEITPKQAQDDVSSGSYKYSPMPVWMYSTHPSAQCEQTGNNCPSMSAAGAWAIFGVIAGIIIIGVIIAAIISRATRY